MSCGCDVMWFSSLKKLYRERWNHWYTYHEQSNTLNGNAKSPGYVLSSQWINEIWSTISPDLIVKSFQCCDFHNDHIIDTNNNLKIRMDNLHSVLKQILVERMIIQSTIEIETSVEDNFDADLFDISFGEEDDRVDENVEEDINEVF